MVDVVVVGGGPAGRSVAAACVDTGLRVALVDPSPRRVWPQTYGAWRDELPATTPVASVMDRMRVFGTSEHAWDRPYAVLDNAALWRRLWRESIDEYPGKAVSAEHGPAGSTVFLRDGNRIATAVVVDASGAARALSGGRPSREAAVQSAVGLVLDVHRASTLCSPDMGVFMDWRPAPDTRAGWPTFLYAVRLPEDRMLLEETSLARRPALPLALLRRRLKGRLDAAGITVPEDTEEERVRFPVDDPVPAPSRVVPFGAAGGLVHPTSGYSVTSTLRLAPWLASAIAAGLSSGPDTAARAAWSVLWPRSAQTANRLRRQALRALLGLPPHLVPEFFETFFRLDPTLRAGFLSPGDEAATTAAAMTAVFRQASWPLRRRLFFGGFTPGNRQARHGLGGV